MFINKHKEKTELIASLRKIKLLLVPVIDIICKLLSTELYGRVQRFKSAWLYKFNKHELEKKI